MTRPVFRACVLVLSMAVVTLACGTPTAPTTSAVTTLSNATTPITPTTPTTVTTETYNGRLASGGVNYHIFHTMPGVMTVTLVSLDPSTLYPPVGLGLGMWDGMTCTLVLSNDAAAPASTLTGTASIETDVCVKVWDPTPFDPSLTVGYQVTASHYVKTSS